MEQSSKLNSSYSTIELFITNTFDLFLLPYFWSIKQLRLVKKTELELGHKYQS